VSGAWLDAITVRTASARQEQEWIAFALSVPLTQPRLRVWAYDAAAVVLGCSGRTTAVMQERAIAANVELGVRRSGGGAVLLGPWLLGASVVLPSQHPLVVASIPQSFRWLGVGHAAWLRSIGVDAVAVPTAQPPHGRALPWACFASISHWEVEADGGKIVGLAQYRRRHAVVFSSAVLLAAPPWEVLCNVLGKPPADAAELSRRTRSCGQILARPAPAAAEAPSLLLSLATVLEALDEYDSIEPSRRRQGEPTVA
jgi:lipoate-protein ligase A